MSGLTVALVYLAGVTALAYFQATLKTVTISAGVLFFVYLLFGSGSTFWIIFLLLSTALSAILGIDDFRRDRIIRPLFNWYKSVLPPISDTEREAIDAGTVWWEGELFTGKPDWGKLLKPGKPALTAEEQALLDGPVEELCSMVDTWKAHFETADVPPEVIAHIKRHKLLGMIIPQEYGGLELSAVAQSAVMTKVFSAGSLVGNYIGVPNSLGPGELLVKYGTREQKQYYLPRLADGEEIPCFALTAPLAGSDATSIPDTGVVCRGDWEGEEIIGMKLNFNKRYITLAPVATLVGLAFRLQDPDKLIGDTEDYGITCALLPGTTKGLELGTRHLPIGDPFLNGPVRGKDIFVPLDYIIGGKEMAGKGWRMLVNCLSTGRVISLPSAANSMVKNALATTSAYARIRKQFSVPIGEFEGIQKPLARIAGLTYIINAGLNNTAQAVAIGAKPAVPASILKYHCTEMARLALADAMDIQAGKSVMKGPRNPLAVAYESIPVAITVEGANIMTRNLMIFGQGAIRSHPFVLDEMRTVDEPDHAVAVKQFDKLLSDHMAYTHHNGARALVAGLSSSFFERVPAFSSVKRYYQHINRLSAAFAITADIAMLIMQSSLKRREMISARLGDLLSMLYLASMVLKQYEDDACPDADLPLVEWSCQYLFHQYQVAMQEILQNFPSKLVALKLKLIIFPLGKRFSAPSDHLDAKIAKLVLHDTDTRKRLIAGIYAGSSQYSIVGELTEIIKLADDVAHLERKLKSAVKQGKIPSLLGMALIDAGESAGILNKAEAKQMRDYDKRIMNIINVDEFTYNAFARSEKSEQVNKATAKKKTARKVTKRTTKKVAKKTSKKRAVKNSTAASQRTSG